MQWCVLDGVKNCQTNANLGVGLTLLYNSITDYVTAVVYQKCVDCANVAITYQEKQEFWNTRYRAVHFTLRKT